MKNKIAYTQPSIGELEIAFVTDAVTNGWGEKCYDYIHRLEKGLCNYLGVKHTVATSSCTGAMHMGLAALGIGSGDEVILADTNWIATVAPVKHLGATPVFVDIDPENWCLDTDAVERAITPKTKAIIAVHLYGNLCDMNALNDLATKHKIALIEDAAEALGSEYQGQKAGSIGTFSTFSFHGTKTMTTGEGGIFATNDTELFERVLTLSNHGRRRGQTKQFWPEEIGFKYKMSNIQAALGCAQLERIDYLVSKKRYIYAYYREALADIESIRINPEPHDCINSGWMPTIVFSEQSGITNDMASQAFAKENIDTRIFFWPLSSLPMFSEQTENKNSYAICKRAINLPSYVDMTDQDMDRVIKVVRGLCNVQA